MIKTTTLPTSQRLKAEEWLPVVGYEDRYKVSNHGNVMSIRTGLKMKPFLAGNDNNYLSVSLCRDGKRRR